MVFLGNSAAELGQSSLQILRRAGQPGGPGGLADDFVFLIDQAGGHGGAAKIDADGITHSNNPPISSAEALRCSFKIETSVSALLFTTWSAG